MTAIGLLGLGSMGSAIASNLVRRGIDVLAWNRSALPSDVVANAGAAAATPEEALARPVSISMLADDDAVARVLTPGVLSAAVGRIHICMSSISPQASDRLERDCRAVGVTYIAAPVLGRPEVAARGDLNVVAGGPPDAIDQVQPVLDVIGRKTWRVGTTPRTANVVKIAVNYNIIHALHALGESMAMVEAHGAAPSEFAELLSSTMFGGTVHQVYGPMIAERKYRPAGFTLGLGLKDLRLAIATAEEVDVDLPSADVLLAMFQIVMDDDNLDGADWSAIAEATRYRAGPQ